MIITLKRVVAGGLAGMLAKSVVAPVDRIKILFQVTNERFSFKKVCDHVTMLLLLHTCVIATAMDKAARGW